MLPSFQAEANASVLPKASHWPISLAFLHFALACHAKDSQLCRDKICSCMRQPQLELPQIDSTIISTFFSDAVCAGGYNA